MNKILFCLLFLLTNEFVYSQTGKDSLRTSYSDTSKWVYFKVTDTLVGEILESNNSPCACGVRACASLSIIKVEKDTIRVLDLCNTNDYIKGQKVKIAPEGKPLSQVMLPISYIIDGEKLNKAKKSKIKKQVKREESVTSQPYYNDYDKTIFKTTWGQIIAR